MISKASSFVLAVASLLSTAGGCATEQDHPYAHDLVLGENNTYERNPR